MVDPPLIIECLGRVAYLDAWQLQKKYLSEIASGNRPPTLLLLEHPRTITLGRSAKSENLLMTEEAYRQRGIAFHHIERGGDVTYHGPGQLVGYPLIPLIIKVGDFLRELEQLLLRVVKHLGITARPSPGYAGLWTTLRDGTEAKLASIGIAVSQRVTYHGFALNVTTNLDDFKLIVPCGISQVRMTSLQELLGTSPTMEDVMELVRQEVQQCRWFNKEPWAITS